MNLKQHHWHKQQNSHFLRTSLSHSPDKESYNWYHPFWGSAAAISDHSNIPYHWLGQRYSICHIIAGSMTWTDKGNRLVVKSRAAECHFRRSNPQMRRSLYWWQTRLSGKIVDITWWMRGCCFCFFLISLFDSVRDWFPRWVIWLRSL